MYDFEAEVLDIFVCLCRQGDVQLCLARMTRSVLGHKDRPHAFPSGKYVVVDYFDEDENGRGECEERKKREEGSGGKG